MILESDEKIDMWWIVCKTDKGRKIDCSSEFDLPDSVTGTIDDFFEEDYPVTWKD